MQDITDYLLPLNSAEISGDEPYTDGQLGNHIQLFDRHLPDLEATDIVLIGVNEQRGSRSNNNGVHPADQIRKKLYRLHYWHTDVKIADVGNVKTGATLADTYAAIKTVMRDVLNFKKTIVLLGGSHDVTLAQYESYNVDDAFIEATCIDAIIDIRSESMVRSENFLLDMLTSEPNAISHYNHIGFQSYFVHPRMIETLDKLHFDCYRLGTVKDNILEMEPVLRSSDMVSFDISAIRNSDAPCNRLSPNGFDGIEACTLARFAGMSEQLTSFGLYGYVPENDFLEMTAIQCAQIVWYFIDGKHRQKMESSFEDKHNFNEFHLAFAEVETTFLHSKRTNRWWMQLPEGKYIPCSAEDYKTAARNEIPERWLRVQERL